MSNNNVRNRKPKQLDYSKISSDIEDVIKEPLSDITEREANINFDGKQYLVRFPNDIASAIGIKSGDKIKFRVTLPSPKTTIEEKIEMGYVRGKKHGK